MPRQYDYDDAVESSCALFRVKARPHRRPGGRAADSPLAGAPETDQSEQTGGPTKSMRENSRIELMQ